MQVSSPPRSGVKRRSIEPARLPVRSPTPAPRGWWVHAGKRTFESLAALLLALAAIPVLLVAIVLVKLTSRGAAFYSQVRLGQGRKPFTIYKIRSMKQDCEKTSGAQWSTPGDPRVTPIGRWLRRTHVDELPQLWNVLKGEMSLIGPRPERPEFVPQLEKVILGYEDRLLVRPGMSGLAQVQLPPDTDLASVRRKLAYDLHYVRQLNFRLDLKVLCHTLGYAIGIPFHLTNRLLPVPTGSDVEKGYESWATAMPSQALVETVPSWPSPQVPTPTPT